LPPLPALHDAFIQLGGAPVLDHLHALHDATGKAAYITVSKPSGETPPVRARLDALKAALRTYVLQVVASRALDASPAGTELAAKLLQPLLDYEPPKGKSGGASRPADEGEEDQAQGAGART
jgi:hypothetical protein